MRLLIYILLVAITGALGFGCHRKVSDPRLLKAETMVDDHPDSVLTMLDSIGEESFSGELDRADFVMLHAMAAHKCYAAADNDSTLEWAVEVFSHNRDLRREVITRFYLGTIYNEKGDYAKALLNFYSARQLAGRLGDDFWSGMACRGIADVYAATYSASDAEAYAKEAYGHFKKSGRQPYLRWALHDIGTALHLKKDTEGTVRIADQLRDSAVKYDDEGLLYASQQMKMAAYLLAGDYSNALPCAERLIAMAGATAMDSLHYGLALANEGRVEEARRLVERLPEVDVPLKSAIMSNIHLKKGALKEAWNENCVYSEASDSIWDIRTGSNLNSTLNAYFDLRDRLHVQEEKNSRYLMIIIVLCSLLVAGVALFFFWRYRKKHIERSERDLAAINTLEENIRAADMRRNDLSDKARALVDTQNRILDQIANSMAAHIYKKEEEKKEQDKDKTEENKKEENKDKKQQDMEEKEETVRVKLKKEMAKEMNLRNATKLLNQITASLRSDDTYFAEMEEYVNAQTDGLLQQFREDLPGLKKDDYRLFLLSVVGLSTSAMRVLLKTSEITSLYQRRKRLKNKISTLPEERAKSYLEYFA